MKIQFYDTVVTTIHGDSLHFDVLIPSYQTSEDAVHYAQEWMKQQNLSTNEVGHFCCHYCHSEQATPEVEAHIDSQGYHILPLPK